MFQFNQILSLTLVILLTTSIANAFPITTPLECKNETLTINVERDDSPVIGRNVIIKISTRYNSTIYEGYEQILHVPGTLFVIKDEAGKSIGSLQVEKECFHIDCSPKNPGADDDMVMRDIGILEFENYEAKLECNSL